MSKKKADFESQLRRGKQKKPPRICIYGDHGIGKSTLASHFPDPIFISTEDGLDTLDVVSFERAESATTVAENIQTLLSGEHNFKTCVIDSVDWLVEPLIVKSVEDTYDAKSCHTVGIRSKCVRNFVRCFRVLIIFVSTVG